MENDKQEGKPESNLEVQSTPFLEQAPEVFMGPRVQVKEGWAEHGKRGRALGRAALIVGQSWIPVKWDGEDEPDWFKTRGLELEPDDYDPDAGIV